MAFVKTHKTGSTTLRRLFDRFGYSRGLSFVLIKNHPMSGHNLHHDTGPDIKKRLLPPLGAGRGAAVASFRYDMMNIHIRYNRPVMDTVMKPGSRYVTILRKPSHQFESAFVHFTFNRALLPADLKACRRSTPCQMRRFLERGDFYRKRLKDYRYVWSKNGQAFDLGLDHAFHDDRAAVSAHIEKLAAEFDLVMITEHLHESLLLLKRLLCWDWSDILFVSRNVRTTQLAVPEELREQMRRWNAVDARLYAHFNATLWTKIAEYGPDFQEDLAEFRRLLEEMESRCVASVGMRKASGNRRIFVNQPATNSTLECQYIVGNLTPSVWRKQKGNSTTPSVNALTKSQKSHRG